MIRIKQTSGFTLIEVLITVMILGTLTVLAAQSMQQAVQSKTKIQAQIDDVSRMRDTLRIMERDINLAFHYRDLEKELDQLIQKYQKPQTATNPALQPGGVPTLFTPDEGQGPFQGGSANPDLAPRQDPRTHFIGSEEAVHFVTRNNARMTTQQKFADFAEVSYSVKDCKSLKVDGGSSQCLWRRSHPYVDEDVTAGGTEIVLLENVTEFALKYIGKGKQDWVTAWRSDEGGDGVTKNNFPLAVEISMTIEKEEKGKTKKYSMQVVAPLHFPNNPPPPATGALNAPN